MPKRVRCTVCPPRQVKSKRKPRPAPKYDGVASAITAALLGVTQGAEEDSALRWVNEHGAWMTDDVQRAEVYGAVALEVFDVMMSGRTVRHADSLRDAIAHWSQTPTEESRAAVRKVARRLYDSQHADGNDWFAARALVCLGRIASMGRHSAEGLVEALTWDKESRTEFYEHLWAARRQLETLGTVGVLCAEADTDSQVRVGDLRGVGQAARATREEFDRVWNEEYPQIGDHHAPLLFRLQEVYELARSQHPAGGDQ